MGQNRTDVHNHFLPGIDDGCSTYEESAECIKRMMAYGYSRFFLTPHTGATEFSDLHPRITRAAMSEFQRHMTQMNITAEFRAGGELRLTPETTALENLDQIPTFGMNSIFCLADLWEPDWPDWADAAIDWLHGQGLTVILAHPERMECIKENPDFIGELAKRELLFQGNLGPLGGSESLHVQQIAEKFLMDGRYFMLGSDCHRPDQIATRMAGLEHAIDLVGEATVDKLTIENPGKLWV
ncbi:MAG TPA: CpsB/CapC family capsule biosynthesis tyrosine phosphatase [Phycisphaerae bacterium]|nr:CpsB/CapC family capsule biosynthesis tyrosine phosphatase [Phycisphaerae bacterium]